MIIKSLELSNFRNYEQLKIDLSPNVSIFYGNNAQGKTNILEALYVACTTKSQKGSRDRELIRFNDSESHIRLMVDDDGISRKIDMHLKDKGQKGVAIDGIPIKKAAELYGMMNIISFSQDDLGIIKEGPSERRRFCDMELCQLDKLYMHNLAVYEKALEQRNNLLKQLAVNSELKDTLDIWDEQLVGYGKYIIEKRKFFIEEINKIAFEIHKTLTSGIEELKIDYLPNVGIDEFKEVLLSNRDKDIILKTTSIGPHRDDMVFMLNGNDAKKFGSQGQQRTAALTLKLSELELVKQRKKKNPVLLLDDVLSELDRNRQTKLLENISGVQTVITCTGLDEFVKNRVKYDKVYKVVAGTVTEEKI
ncbi:MAG: DNA replication/repair protein RecF [Lachnospiraceae bacterium]|nr:DNA replication/repair protein RecF [Lachnospiraceae bacterium]